jgi:hypothetical protein
MFSKVISILSTLFIFAIVVDVWSNPGKSVNEAANQVKAVKITENKSAAQKKKKPAVTLANPIRKGPSKSSSVLERMEERADTKGGVDFLKAVEEMRKGRWIHFDQVIYSPEFPRSACMIDFLSSREASSIKSPRMDFSQSISNLFPAGNNDSEGGAKLKILRHLESRKDEMREIFMGLRFSFTPTSRHVVFEMNLPPSSEKGTGLIIPF